MKKNLQPLTPAALYARVSSDRQDVDLSVSAQLRALKEYAKANGYSVAREYIDEAESGRVADRPQFREMIEEGSKPKAPFDVILVWKFSRFTRKREHAVAFKSQLRRKGIRVVSITEQAEDNATGRLLEGIIESVDEYYSENLAQEVVRGMREAALRGFFLGSKAPFGYRKVKVSDGAKERPTLEVDPATAPVVKEIFEKYPAGQRPQGAMQGAEREGRHQQGEALVQGNAPLRVEKRSLHRRRRLGQDEQGPRGRRPCKGGRSMARPGVEGVVRGRAAGDERPSPEGAEARQGGQPVPSERPPALRGVRQALLGPGSQERPVRLLHLRHPVQGGSGNVQRPLPERTEAGDVRGRENQGEDFERGDHRGPGDAGGRGDRRDGRGAFGQAGGHRGRARGREEAA